MKKYLIITLVFVFLCSCVSLASCRDKDKDNVSEKISEIVSNIVSDTTSVPTAESDLSDIVSDNESDFSANESELSNPLDESNVLSDTETVAPPPQNP